MTKNTQMMKIMEGTTMSFITRKERDRIYDLISRLTNENLDLIKKIKVLETSQTDLKAKIDTLSKQNGDIIKIIENIKSNETSITPEDLLQELFTGKTIEEIRAQNKGDN